DYTLGKALSDKEQSFSTQISTCRRCDHGPDAQDVRHHLVISSLIEVPFGRGRRFGNGISRAADLIAGGWTLTGITAFSTGLPVYVSEANTTGMPYFNIRPNRVCDGRDSRLSGNLRNNGFLDFQTSCFQQSAVGYFGTAGRNVLNAPGTNN